MQQLAGVRIGANPFQDARWERDLLIYDGPVLSLYRDQKDEPVLYYWCDVEQATTRWIVFEVHPEQLLAYEEHREFLSALIRHPKNNILFAVDIDATGYAQNSVALTPSSLPSNYLPDPMAEITAENVIGAHSRLRASWAFSMSGLVQLDTDFFSATISGISAGQFGPTLHGIKNMLWHTEPMGVLTPHNINSEQIQRSRKSVFRLA